MTEFNVEFGIDVDELGKRNRNRKKGLELGMSPDVRAVLYRTNFTSFLDRELP